MRPTQATAVVLLSPNLVAHSQSARWAARRVSSSSATRSVLIDVALGSRRRLCHARFRARQRCPAVLPLSHSTARPGYVMASAIIGGGRAVLVAFPPLVQHRRAGVVATAAADSVARYIATSAPSLARRCLALAVLGYTALLSARSFRGITCRSAFGPQHAAFHRVRPNPTVNRTRRHML